MPTFECVCAIPCAGVLCGIQASEMTLTLQLQLVAPFSTSWSSRWASSTSCTRRRCDSFCNCSICRWHAPPSRRSQRNASRTSSSVWRLARSHTQLEDSTRRTSSSSPSSWRWRFSCKRKLSNPKSFSASSKVRSSLSVLIVYREVVIATKSDAVTEWNFARMHSNMLLFINKHS